MADNARRLAPSRSLEGKLAIVSGGSRGIGAAVARNLAAKGCALVLNHTSASSDAAAAALAQELAAAHGVRAVPVRADISTEAGCAAIVAAAKGGESELRVDILINNAGVQSKAFLGELKVEEWERVYRINVLGTMLLTQAVLPYLPWDRSGRIVNMSSIVNSQVRIPVPTRLDSGRKADGWLTSVCREWLGTAFMEAPRAPSRP